MNSSNGDDKGISEIVGSLILIGIFVAVIGAMGVFYLSQPAPQKVPAINMVFSNESNVVMVYHGGGDPIPVSQLTLIVNGVNTSFSGAGNDNTWSLGETISAAASQMPGRVDVVYTGVNSAGFLLATMIFGQLENPPPLGTFFTISASAGPHGVVSPSGSVVVASGSDRTILISPESGYRIADVMVDGSSVGSVASYTFTRVTSSHTLSASFIPAPLAPVANFTGAPTSGTFPLSVVFTDLSTNAPTSWSWNFGDGTNSTVDNPVHNYENAGMYTVMLTATNAGGSNTVSKINYITVYPAPTVTAITPNNGNRGWPIIITNLVGTGFRSGATVKLNRSGQPDITGTGITVVSATQITCSVALSGVSPGTWNVVVTNSDGSSGQRINGFTVNSPAPTLSTRNPTTGNRGWPVNVLLTGTGFQPGASVNMTRSGSTPITATGVVVVSPTQISCTFNLNGATAASNWAIRVTNTDGKSSGTLAFTVASPAPTVSAITPANGVHGTTVTITSLSGTGFQPGATVLFASNSGMNQNTMSLTNVNVISPTQISGTLVIPPGQSINTYYIRVTNTDSKNGRSASRIFRVT